jgi:hypothetical protein
MEVNLTEDKTTPSSVILLVWRTRMKQIKFMEVNLFLWLRAEMENKMIVVIFEFFTLVTIKNAFFLDVASCRSCVNRRLGGMYRLHLQGRKSSSEEPAWAGGCNSVWAWNLVSDIKEEHRLRVFKNRALRRIFWPRREEVRRLEKTA